MSVIPAVTAVQLLPAALAAGRVATKAIGGFAEMLHDAIQPDDPATTTPAAKRSSTTSADGFSTLLRDFAKAFNRLLENRGLDAGTGVTLRLNETGEVDVADSHPRASGIENLFRQSAELSERFRQIAIQATGLQREREFAAFQEDPDRSLRFGRETFQLQIRGDAATPAFR